MTLLSEQDHYLEKPVDAEHSGVRLAGCLTLIISFAVILGISLILFTQYLVLAFLVSAVLAGIITYILDKRIKKLLPSKRRIRIDDHQISLYKGDTLELSLDPQKQINLLYWRFPVPRAHRVPKGWWVTCIALDQDDTMLALYTFIDPKEFDSMPKVKEYIDLKTKKDLEKLKSSDLKLAGIQRRLHEAERVRELNGAELAPEDYKEVIEYMQKRFGKWML
ncbi:hypothetical protein MASR2M15_09290 [Anaerolineales bacterium]